MTMLAGSCCVILAGPFSTSFGVAYMLLVMQDLISGSGLADCLRRVRGTGWLMSLGDALP